MKNLYCAGKSVKKKFFLPLYTSQIHQLRIVPRGNCDHLRTVALLVAKRMRRSRYLIMILEEFRNREW